MNHRVDQHWGMARLREELAGAVAVVQMYDRMHCLAPRQERRRALWREFEDQLRDRMTVVLFTPALDALEAAR